MALRADRVCELGLSRLPGGFVVPDEWVAVAASVRPELSVARIRSEAVRFVGHWNGKQGREGVRRDWLATWLGWIARV